MDEQLSRGTGPNHPVHPVPIESVLSSVGCSRDRLRERCASDAVNVYVHVDANVEPYTEMLAGCEPKPA